MAQNLKKDVGLLVYAENESRVEEQKMLIENDIAENKLENIHVFVRPNSVKDLAQDCELLEASFLMIQWETALSGQLRNYLKYCRDLRIPYLFFKDSFAEIHFQKVLVPVGFLIEEYEKTQFASAFGRFCNAEITILQANDYGSKAKTTVEKMKLIFDTFELNYVQEKAQADSFKLDKEAVAKGKDENFDVILISSSREYGLDDVIFGPKELRLVKKSTVPLLLINPRGDLYTLCE